MATCPQRVDGTRYQGGTGLKASSNLINAHVRRCVQQRLETADHVGGEKLALQVGVRVLLVVKAVQHLHVFVTHQQLLRLRAGDSDQHQESLMQARGSPYSTGFTSEVDSWLIPFHRQTR